MKSQHCCPCPCEPKETVLLPITGIRLPGLGSALEVDASALKNCGCEVLHGLQEPYDLFVSTEGSDVNDGKTAETSMRTVQGAVNRTNSFIRRGRPVTIHIADGEYNEGVAISFDWHYPSLRLEGSSTSGTVIKGHLRAKFSGYVAVMNLTCVHTASSTESSGVAALVGTQMQLNKVDVVMERTGDGINGVLSSHAWCGLEGVAIRGGAGTGAAIRCSQNGYLLISKTDVHFDCLCSATFLTRFGGHIHLINATLTGSCSGQQYNLYAGGISSLASSSIPGNLNGHMGASGYFETIS